MPGYPIMPFDVFDLSWTLYIYVLFVVSFAGLIHGAMGLGFPMIATPLIAIFLDVRLAILLTLLPTVSVNVASIWDGDDYRNSLSEYRALLLFVLIGAIFGANLLVFLDPAPFRLVLAILILTYLGTTLFGWVPTGWFSDKNTGVMIGFGLIAGISGGITNVMVAVLVIYFISIGIRRTKMVPILNTCFLLGKLSQITILSFAGLVSLGLLYQTAPFALAAVVSLFGGQRLASKISLQQYQNLLYVLLFGLAMILIVQFVGAQ